MDMRKKQFTRFVGIMLSEESYEEMVAVTDKLQISVSEFIRNVVERHLNERRLIREMDCSATKEREYGGMSGKL